MASDPSALIQGLVQGSGLGGQIYSDAQNQPLAREQAQQQIAVTAATLQAKQAEVQQAQQYQTDTQAVLTNGGKPEDLARLAIKYPDKYQGLKSAWDMQDQSKRDADIGVWANVKGALDGGRPDLAISALQQRRDAEYNAKIPTDDLDSLLSGLKAGDPASLKLAEGYAQTHLALADKDGKFAESLSKLNDQGKGFKLAPGEVQFDGSGHQIASVAAKPDDPKYEKITNADGSESIVQVGGGGQASAGGTGGTVPTTLPDIADRIGVIEGTGRNASSSASGYGQFTNGTWLRTFKSQNPNSGLTDAQILAQKSNPTVAKTMLGALTAQNAQVLQAGGVAPTAPNIYLAHFLGPTDALAVAHADPNTPVSQIVSPASIRANPSVLGGKTAGQIQQWATQKMTAGAPNSGASGTGAADGGASPVKVLYTSKPSDSGVDSATVDFYGQKVAAGGDLPAFGMGKQAAALRQAILARAAQIQTGKGMSGGDSNLLHADVKTATTALGALQRTRNSLNPYLQTFDGASAQVRALAPQAVGGSIPIFNRWIQAGRTNISGDPAVTKFNVAINAVANENAKIMSGASGGAVSSDSARHEAMSLINNTQTLDQLNAALDQMHTDTQIRVKSLDDRQAELRNTISGRAPASSAPPAPAGHAPAGVPAGSKPIGTYQGKSVFMVNGKRMVAQ